MQPLKPLWSRDKACEKITRVNGLIAVADSDLLHIRWGGGGVGVCHPDPEIRASVWSKNKGLPGPSPGSAAV